MTQTLAIFLDAYRELNARKLFWITLALSALVVLVFVFVNINEQGLRIVVWDIPSMLNTETISKELFFKSMFVGFGINFWLAWLATILALTSTASIIPDYIAGGAIDTVLSKPIGRVRLFLTKYATGLLFVTLQVAVFSAASFVVLGVKGGAWEPSVFLAIPLVVIFFSYLFCVCVLLGMVTRSTIASLLLTLLFWMFLFGVNATENTLLLYKFVQEQQIERDEASLASREAALAAASGGDGANQAMMFESERENFDRLKVVHQRLEKGHRVAMAVKTVLPKTAETINLLERSLIDLAELPENNDPPGHAPRDMVRAQEQLAESLRARSVWWVIGTSLLFEAVVLLLTVWLFVRRDF